MKHTLVHSLVRLCLEGVYKSVPLLAAKLIKATRLRSSSIGVGPGAHKGGSDDVAPGGAYYPTNLKVIKDTEAPTGIPPWFSRILYY